MSDQGLDLGRPMDNTALSAYMACPREYYLSMVLGRRGEGRSAALAFGSLMHTLLEAHYKFGGEVDLAEVKARNWWKKNGVETEGDYRTFERALLVYRAYREKWGQTPDLEQGRTVGYPQAPMVEIATNVRAGDLIHPWAVKLDRIIELGGLNYVEDHKTTSRLDKNYYSSFELSNQMMGYTYVAKHLMPSLRIVGIRLNVMHVLKDKTNFERQLFSFTDQQLDEWASNTNEWLRHVSTSMASWQTLYQLGVPKPGQAWPRAHFGDNGCSRKYGLCQYHSACRVAPQFRHRVVEEIPVHHWNPMEVDD